MRFARKGLLIILSHSPTREGIIEGLDCQRFLGGIKVEESRFTAHGLGLGPFFATFGRNNQQLFTGPGGTFSRFHPSKRAS